MRQARTRAGEVVLPSGKLLFIRSNHFHAGAYVNYFNYVFYAFPQIISDEDCDPVGVWASGDAEVRDECSLDSSRCFKNEGTFAVHLVFVFYCER